jgi:PAS domain S-box-containing protein
MAQVFRNEPGLSRLPSALQTSRLRGYLIAVALVGIAVLVSEWLKPLFGGVPFLLLWPAVVLSAWWGGFGAGLLASFLAVVARNYLDQSSGIAFTLTVTNTLQLGIFSVISIFINWFQATQRRQDAALRQEREWLSITLASIGDGVIATDAAGKILLMNLVAIQLTDWGRQEALGRDITEVFNIVNETTGEPVKIPIMQAIERGMVVGLANHTVLISRNGNRMPISDSGSPIRDAAGNIIGAILVFRDATEQRQAELALEASEAKYRALVEQASDVIFTLDMAGNITSINRAGEELLGYSQKELTHRSMLSLVRPEDRAQAEVMLRPNRVDHQPARYVLSLICKAGQIRTLEFNSRVEQQDGKAIGIHGVARDISARRVAEERNRSLQRFAVEIAGAATTGEIARVITSTAMEAIGGDLSAAFCISEDGKSLERLEYANVDPAIIRKWPTVPFDGTTPIADAIQQKRLIVIETQEEYVRQYPNLESSIRDYGVHGAICLPFWGSEDVIGGMYVSFKSPRKTTLEDQNFLFTLAQICGQAIERAQLTRKAQENAAIEERQRLARELHDAVTQALYSSTMIAQDMRTLLLELRPEAIVRTAMPELLNQLVQAVSGRKNMKGTFTVEGDNIELTPEAHLAFYRIAQEGLNNVVKHRQATAFSVTLRRNERHLTLEVTDDGQGFDITQVPGGFGLGSMRERADGIGASLELVSRPQQGTTVRVRWSIPPAV